MMEEATMEEEELKEQKSGKRPLYIPRRYILCVLMFGAFLTMNCQRSCLSVAIVAMSSKTRHWDGRKWILKPAEFDWDSEKKGILLGAFFYGYLILQIPAGSLCMKYGGKRVLGFAVWIGSLLNIAIPVVVRYNEDYLFINRVVQGFVFGAVLPTNHYFWGKWAPTKEKATLVSFSVAGLSTGMLMAYPISGLLCTYGFAGGWPSVFYVFGGAGLLWTIAWYFLAADSPQEHPSISKEELSIMDQIESSGNQKQQIPWLKILTSVPVWGVIIANFTFDSIYYTLLITMPLFLRDVHKFNVTTTGYLSAMPWLFMTIMISTAGVLADKVRRFMSVGVTRKVFFNFGVVFSSLFLTLSGMVESSHATIILMCISVSFFGFEFSGFMVNPMDIAPKYAGTIIGISNSAGSIPGFVGPAIVGIMTAHGTGEEWQRVFWLLTGVSLVGGILFTLMGSGKKQKWASYDVVDVDKDGTLELGKIPEDTTQTDSSVKRELESLEKSQGVTNIDKMRDSG